MSDNLTARDIDNMIGGLLRPGPWHPTPAEERHRGPWRRRAAFPRGYKNPFEYATDEEMVAEQLLHG